MLPCFNEDLNHTFWSVGRLGAHVNGEGKLGVELFDQVTKLTSEGKLIVLYPFL